MGKKREQRATPSPRSPYPVGHPLNRASPSPRYMQLGPGYHGPPPNVMVQQPPHLAPPPGAPLPPPGPHPPHHQPPHPFLDSGSDKPPNVMVQQPPHLAPPGAPLPPPGPHPPHHQPPHPFLDSGRLRPGMPPHAGPGFIPHSFNLESRICDMNKRIIQRMEKDNDNAAAWWEAFGNEFFDDHARISLKCLLDNDPKTYTIGRTLIPRYFRSIFDGGVKDLYYVLRGPCREFCPRPDLLVLECENAAIVTKHEKPLFTEVTTEGRLTVEFTFAEEYGHMPPRIRLWYFEIRNHQEFVHRNVLSSLTQESQEQLGHNITRQGMTNVTLNYLRLCLILEPMQHLMSIEKGHRIPPRECLHHFNFQRHAQINPPRQRPAPPPISQPILPPLEPGKEPPRQPAKRKRNRKGSASTGNAGGGKKKAGASASPAPNPAGAPNFPITQHVDVMVVGEPSLMGKGGDFGEEDERMISRLENTQYEPGAPGPMPGGPLPPPGHPMHDPSRGGTPFGWQPGSRGGTPGGCLPPQLGAVPSPAMRLPPQVKSEGLEPPPRTPPVHPN